MITASLTENKLLSMKKTNSVPSAVVGSGETQGNHWLTSQSLPVKRKISKSNKSIVLIYPLNM